MTALAKYIQVQQLPESLQERIISCVVRRSNRNGGGSSTVRICTTSRRVKRGVDYLEGTPEWRAKGQAGNGKRGNSVVPPSPELADQRQMMLGGSKPK